MKTLTVVPTKNLLKKKNFNLTFVSYTSASMQVRHTSSRSLPDLVTECGSRKYSGIDLKDRISRRMEKGGGMAFK